MPAVLFGVPNKVLFKCWVGQGWQTPVLFVHISNVISRFRPILVCVSNDEDQNRSDASVDTGVARKHRVVSSVQRLVQQVRPFLKYANEFIVSHRHCIGCNHVGSVGTGVVP